jgi:hypothetical protein
VSIVPGGVACGWEWGRGFRVFVARGFLSSFPVLSPFLGQEAQRGVLTLASS